MRTLCIYLVLLPPSYHVRIATIFFCTVKNTAEAPVYLESCLDVRKSSEHYEYTNEVFLYDTCTQNNKESVTKRPTDPGRTE